VGVDEVLTPHKALKYPAFAGYLPLTFINKGSHWGYLATVFEKKPLC
jgi:hypothetical protein